ncbi:MAG: HAD family hydrolase [Promethearchaeota archaeon]
MINVTIPHFGTLELENLVLDMNGTIADDGKIYPHLEPYFKKLSRQLNIVVLTADTFGTVNGEAVKFGLNYYILPKKKPGGIEKRDYVTSLGANGVVALGNGNNDAFMLESARLGIAVLGREGLAKECLLASDMVVKEPADALNLLLEPRKLIATLRK